MGSRLKNGQKIFVWGIIFRNWHFPLGMWGFLSTKLLWRALDVLREY